MERPQIRNAAKIGLFVLGGLYSAAALDHLGKNNNAAIEYGIEGLVFTLGGVSIKAYELGKERRLETAQTDIAENVAEAPIDGSLIELDPGESQAL